VLVDCIPVADSQISGGDVTGGFTTSVTPPITPGQCLVANSNGVFTNSSSCGTAGAVSFSGITSGTNTTATMTVGSGGSLTTSGTGTVTATGITALTSQVVIESSGTIFEAYDGTPQFSTAYVPTSAEFWGAEGGITGSGATLYSHNLSGTGNVSGNFTAQNSGGFNFGNGSNQLFEIDDPGLGNSTVNWWHATGGTAASPIPSFYTTYASDAALNVPDTYNLDLQVGGFNMIRAKHYSTGGTPTTWFEAGSDNAALVHMECRGATATSCFVRGQGNGAVYLANDEGTLALFDLASASSVGESFQFKASNSANGQLTITSNDGNGGLSTALPFGLETVTLANLPATGIVAGSTVFVTNVGIHGTQYFYNGTSWAPSGNAPIVIARATGSIASPIATLSSVTSGTFNPPGATIAIPAGILSANSKVHVETLVHKTGGTAAFTYSVYLGTNGSTSDNTIQSIGLGSTAGEEIWTNVDAYLASTTSYTSPNYLPANGASSNAIVTRTTNFNAASINYVTFYITGGNASDTYLLVSYLVTVTP
jgi:hypothetical protein